MNQSMKALIENFFIQTGRDNSICEKLIEIFDPIMDFVGYKEIDEDLEETLSDLKSKISELEDEIEKWKELKNK